MWRNLFKKNHRVVEVREPSGQRRMMSLDEFREQMLMENRERLLHWQSYSTGPTERARDSRRITVF